MALFDIFRRRTIVDRTTLGQFIDVQASLLAEQTVQDYSSLRAGTGAKALLADPAFRAALEGARLEAFPLALTMMSEMTTAVLRTQPGGDAHAVAAGLRDLVLGAFDSKPTPQTHRNAAAWSAAREELSSALGDLGNRPVKPIEAIVEAHAGHFLALMPLHPKLGGDDFPALRNALAAALDDIRGKFVRQADLRVLASVLAAHTG